MLGGRLLARPGLAAVRRASTQALILGVDTSCDDTSAAVVSSDGDILSNVVASQWAQHAESKGVDPCVAKEAHERVVGAVIERALAEASVTAVAAVAVTTGPGLVPCLRVGVGAAAALAGRLGVPLHEINHLEGHVLTPRLADRSLSFPYLALLLSGGHSQFVLCHGVGSYELLGGTLDDALGEAFDKVARILGLPFFDFETGLRASAALERLAQHGDAQRLRLPRPLDKRKKCGDMSFSGLKSCIARLHEHPARGSDYADADIAAAFQDTAFAHVADRLKYCLAHVDQHKHKLSGVVLCGGVAANLSLRARLQAVADARALPLLVPPARLCSDNGAMIAWVAHEQAAAGLRPAVASPSSPPICYARWSLDPNVDSATQYLSTFPTRSPSSKPWKHRQSTK